MPIADSQAGLNQILIMSVRFRGIIALLIVTLVWGTTFPAMKDLSADFSAVWIICIRFVFGGLLLSPFLIRAKHADYLGGAMLGAVLFISFMFQLEGLALTSANRNAFVTGLNVLIVPLLGLLAGRIPDRRIVVGILLAIAGLFALCWEGGAWGRGDMLALAGAVFFGLYVKLMETTTRRATDLMTLTAVQVAAVAFCAIAWLLLFDGTRNRFEWDAIQDGMQAHYANLIYLVVIATAAIISLQTWGQRHASANEAAVIYAFEPACAAAAAYFWLAEIMTWRGLAGGLLLICGIIASQWNAGDKVRRADHAVL